MSADEAAEARAAYALFAMMGTADLLGLLAAHRADRAGASAPDTIAFCAGREALIAAVLATRARSAGILRLRYQVRGAHVHGRLFSSPLGAGAFALCGELVFSLDEWPAVRAGLAGVEMVVEDEAGR